ncbi:hypothetical protein OMK68_24315 [Rhodococcus pyridinivorans]|uniref:hypothetical protein n=1 Tax=Rhodococcus pyridinivorans TaxID=103816 RepID=UPI002226C0B5|nr:hypothetical protein [Rhodococcus pyridinivorans]MCW3472706.1 hypothetical protein [Rhodococcus pyridinivorans]
MGINGQPITVSDSIGFILLQRQVQGHYGSLPHHVSELIRLIERGRLDLSASITDEIPLAEAQSAVDRLANKVGDPIRLILRP